MKTQMKNFIKIMILLSLFISCSHIKSEGEKEAFRDINNGVLKIKIYGELFANERLYSRFMDMKYGIKIQRVAGCILSNKEIRNFEVYNRIMKGAIKSKYGIPYEEMGVKENVLIGRRYPETNDSLYDTLYYDTTVLVEAYRKLLPLTIDSVKKLFNEMRGKNIVREFFGKSIQMKTNIDTIYSNDINYLAYEQAVVRALVEKGLLPYRDCFSGNICLTDTIKDEIIKYRKKGGTN